MKYTIVATEARSHHGDAYNITTCTSYKVLGTVEAASEADAVKVMQATLTAETRPYTGSVIVVPGTVVKIFTGYIHAR